MPIIKNTTKTGNIYKLHVSYIPMRDLWLLLNNEPVIDRFHFIKNVKPNKNWFESIFKTIAMMIDYGKHIWNDKVTSKSKNLKIKNYIFRHDHSLNSYFKTVSVLVLAIITKYNNTTTYFDPLEASLVAKWAGISTHVRWKALVGSYPNRRVHLFDIFFRLTSTCGSTWISFTLWHDNTLWCTMEYLCRLPCLECWVFITMWWLKLEWSENGYNNNDNLSDHLRYCRIHGTGLFVREV